MPYNMGEAMVHHIRMEWLNRKAMLEAKHGDVALVDTMIQDCLAVPGMWRQCPEAPTREDSPMLWRGDNETRLCETALS